MVLCAELLVAALVNDWFVDGTHFLLVSQAVHICMIAPMGRKVRSNLIAQRNYASALKITKSNLIGMMLTGRTDM